MRDLTIPPTVTRRLQAYYTDYLEPWLKSYVAPPPPAGLTWLDWAAQLARKTTLLREGVEPTRVLAIRTKASPAFMIWKAGNRKEAVAEPEPAWSMVWAIQVESAKSKWEVQAETQREVANEVVRRALSDIWDVKTLEEAQWRQLQALFPKNDDDTWRFPPLHPGDEESEAIDLLEKGAKLVLRTIVVVTLQQTPSGWFVDGLLKDGNETPHRSILLACEHALNRLMNLQKTRTEKAWADFRAMADLVVDAAAPN